MGLKSTQFWRVRKTSSEPNVLVRHLRKSSIRTTCNLPLRVIKHLNQRRWWLYKVWAPSKIIVFDGAQIYTVLTWVRKNSIEPNVLVRHLAQEFHSEQHLIFLPLQVVKTSEPKKMVTRQSLGSIQNYSFWWGSNLHSVDLSQKELYRA